MDIAKIINKVKPDISKITRDLYMSNIKNIHKLVTQSNNITNLEFLNNPSQILSILSNKKPHTIKNYLVSILVLLKSDESKNKKLIEKYNDEIKKLANKIMDNYDLNEKSKSQEKNWVELTEIHDLVKKYKEIYNRHKKKQTLNNSELQDIQDYLLLSLYSGLYFPPVRNDFTDMEIITENELKSIDKDKNYLTIMDNDKIKFIFNKYKTSKKFGTYELPIKSKILTDLILYWIDNNGSDKFLINVKSKKPYTPNMITKSLNRIFQKNIDKTISTSLIRSIYISDNLKKNLNSKDKKKLASDMLHSKSVQENIYNKID